MNDAPDVQTQTEIALEATEKLLANYPPSVTEPVAFLSAQYEAGLAYVSYPVGYGGLGFAPEVGEVVDARLREAGAPPSGRVTNPIAAGQGTATLILFGSEDQKQRYIKPLFTGQLYGCQLYSEPGSGSDLASLATTAVRDGDDWIVNGQKVWTSGAHLAQWGLLLARTNPGVVKHAGLTQFVIDMTAPGVEVRPLRQMSGGAEFNEVFLTDVRIPDSERLGDVGDGWRGSQATLVFERYNVGRTPNRGEGRIALAVEAWKRRADKTSPEAIALRDQMMKFWIEEEVLRLLQWRAGELRASGNTGPEGSLGKLATSVVGRRLAEWMPSMIGAEGMLIDGYDDPPSRSQRRNPGEFGEYDIQRACVGSPGTSIAGGTDQIQRNIIGDRVLGLPREPAVDRDRPWNELARN
ncbi:MAG: acyl-CoA dehydrogenase family protein [Acidimicrobiia bacterium]